MKKIIFMAFAALFALNVSTLKATTVKSKAPAASSNLRVDTAAAISNSEMKQMESRVYQIARMDKSNLSVDQKQQLKNELTAMKDKLMERRPHVVFIFGGVGLIILIILLIVLI